MSAKIAKKVTMAEETQPKDLRIQHLAPAVHDAVEQFMAKVKLKEKRHLNKSQAAAEALRRFFRVKENA
jgi:hypothetical protein